MNISPISFCFEEVNLILSPNRNERPKDAEGNVELLVIHCISLPAGEFGGTYVQDLFLNQLDINAHESFKSLEGVEVSSHLFIDRSGEIIQFVPFSERAWHAGVSNFNGKVNCNNFSIGIELEGTEDIPYTFEQYSSLIACTESILNFYPDIKLDNIVGHSDIAPGRKTDPGDSFDWAYYKLGIKDLFEKRGLEPDFGPHNEESFNMGLIANDDLNCECFIYDTVNITAWIEGLSQASSFA